MDGFRVDLGEEIITNSPTTIQYITALKHLSLIGPISDIKALKVPLEIEISAFSATQDTIYGSHQRILDILGARLSRDDFSDDEMQETS